MIHVDTESFFVIVIVAAVAAATVATVPGRFAPPWGWLLSILIAYAIGGVLRAWPCGEGRRPKPGQPPAVARGEAPVIA